MLTFTPDTGVVVTGGASGIGAASARALAEVGRPVAIWDLADGETLAKEIAEAHDVATIAIRVDVTGSAAFPEAIKSTRQALGTIGGLVHAAGIPGPHALGDLDEAKWDQVLDVNLRAEALLLQALLPDLRTNQGSAVVGISSIEAHVGQAFLPAYCSSKAGLLGLTRAAAHQLAADGIRINAVCPGYIDTPMLRGNTPPAMVELLAAKPPLSRLGRPAEIANAVRFLMSDQASYVTGTYLTVDGGATAVDR